MMVGRRVFRFGDTSYVFSCSTWTRRDEDVMEVLVCKTWFNCFKSSEFYRDQVRENWLRGAQLCVELEGSNFEHLLQTDGAFDEVTGTQKSFFTLLC